MSGLPGYDAWKLRSPDDEREFEPETPPTPEEEAAEAWEYWRAYKVERIIKMRAALEQCAEYFDNRADIAAEHDEDGSPRPNEEMRLLTEIRDALA